MKISRYPNYHNFLETKQARDNPAKLLVDPFAKELTGVAK